MKYFLFRRIKIETEKEYHFYQFFKMIDDELDEEVEELPDTLSKTKENEESYMDDNYNSFEERKNGEFFYLSEDDVTSISENNLFQIYYDGEDDRIYPETNINIINGILQMFYQKYQDFDIESIRPKMADEVIKIVGERIYFQDDNIVDLVSRIYENYSVVTSPLPLELKEEQKTNILFHGPAGGGKKTISTLLAQNLPMPCATITLVPIENNNIDKNIVNIVNQLTRNGASDTMASIGVVFINDNFSCLGSDTETVLKYINALTSCGTISVNGHIINFNMLTFVVLMNEHTEEDRFEVMDAMRITNCEYEVVVDKLTNSQKYYILNSKYGRITYYKAYLQYLGKEFIINESSLKKLVKISSEVELGMNCINQIIDKIIKKNAFEADKEVIIDDEIVKIFNTLYNNDNNVPKKEPEKEEAVKLSVNEMSKVVCQYVKGQDEHVKRIIYVLLNNIRMANKDGLINPKEYIDNILIQGDSGSGKSFMIKNVAKILNIPYVIVDTSQYTQVGYVGASVDSILINLLKKAGGDLFKAQRGIVFMDEVDKKAVIDPRNDSGNEAVLSNLLKMVEGAEIQINVGSYSYPKEINFDTSRLTFVIAGAFEKIDDIIKKRLQGGYNRKLGFNDEVVDKYIDTDITDDDFVEFGMQRQFIARFPEVIRLNKPTQNFLVDILKNSKLSALLIEKTKMEEAGFEIEYTDDFYQELAKRTLKLNVGARGIRKAFMGILRKIHIEDLDSSEIQKIIFNGDVVTDASKIILIPREKHLVKK